MKTLAIWKTATAAALLFFASACAYAQHTAADISDRYYKDSQTTTHCNTSRRPAFLCDGVLLHVTHHPSRQHAWDPTPQEQKQGWVAFSYLRSDSNFSALPDNGHHGYIFYAMFSTPQWAMDLTYLCAYPTFNATGANAPCAYDVSPQGRATNGSATAFERMIAAMNPFGPPNALHAQAWGPDLGYKLPVEAFFYVVLPGGRSGLADAQEDQKDFFTTFSRFVPIVKVTLPAAAGKRASFNYYDADQVETPSSTAGAPTCKPYFQSGEWETPAGSKYPSLRTPLNKLWPRLLGMLVLAGMVHRDWMHDASFDINQAIIHRIGHGRVDEYVRPESIFGLQAFREKAKRFFCGHLSVQLTRP